MDDENEGGKNRNKKIKKKKEIQTTKSFLLLSSKLHYVMCVRFIEVLVLLLFWLLLFSFSISD